MNADLQDARRELESEFDEIFFHGDEAHIRYEGHDHAIIIRTDDTGPKVVFRTAASRSISVGQAWAISTYLAALGISPGAPR